MTSVSQKILFAFLVMVYNRVVNGDKFFNENFGLGRPRSRVVSLLKIETEVFFSLTLMPQCNS